MIKLTDDDVREFNLFVKNFFTILSQQKSLSMAFILQTLEALLSRFDKKKQDKFMKLFIVKSVAKLIKGEKDESNKIEEIKS